MSSPRLKRLKIAVFLLCLSPVAILVWRGLKDDLGANPIEFITHATGTWTLRFLIITLAITPVRRLLSQPKLIGFRRMLGLFAFFYGVLHFITYLWLDQFFDFPAILKDVVKRPFITAGFFGFVTMIPLAVTSTVGWIRRLGGKKWQLLHRLVYLSAIAGVVHYYWLVKSDITSPMLYGTLVALLLGFRIIASAVRRRRQPGKPSPDDVLTAENVWGGPRR